MDGRGRRTEGDVGGVDHAGENSLTRGHRTGRPTHVLVLVFRFDVHAWNKTSVSEDRHSIRFCVPLEMARCEGGRLGSPLGVDGPLLDDSFGLSIWGSLSLILSRGLWGEGGGESSSDSTSCERQ